MRTLIKIKGFDHVELAGITAKDNANPEGYEAQAVIEFSKQSAVLVANSTFVDNATRRAEIQFYGPLGDYRNFYIGYAGPSRVPVSSWHLRRG